MSIQHPMNPGSPGLRQGDQNRKMSFLMEKPVEVERVTQDELRQDLRALFQGAIRITLEMVLEEKLNAMVGARRFERVGSRIDHRSGTFLRRLLTRMGQIGVTVPRSREQGSPTDVIGRYRRRTEESRT